MKLSSEITVTLPDTKQVLKLTELKVTIIDVQPLKKVMAQMPPFFKTLTLWEGAAYDAAGDYTQAQAEARILELLGTDIPAGLLKLYTPIPSLPKLVPKPPVTLPPVTPPRA